MRLGGQGHGAETENSPHPDPKSEQQVLQGKLVTHGAGVCMAQPGRARHPRTAGPSPPALD